MSLGPFARRTIAGGLALSEGAAWTTYTSNDFLDLTTGAAVATDGLPFVELVVRNTHAGQTLYVVLYAAGLLATTNAVPIGPGGTYTFDLSAVGATAVSFQGSGAATTGHAFAQFRVGGGGG